MNKCDDCNNYYYRRSRSLFFYSLVDDALLFSVVLNPIQANLSVVSSTNLIECTLVQLSLFFG